MSQWSSQDFSRAKNVIAGTAGRIRQVVLLAGIVDIVVVISMLATRGTLGDLFGVAFLVGQNLLHFLVYFHVIRSTAGSIIIGAGILLVTAWLHASVLLSSSSTAALGFVSVSFLGFAIVIVGWAVESLSFAFVRRRHGIPPGS